MHLIIVVEGFKGKLYSCKDILDEIKFWDGYDAKFEYFYGEYYIRESEKGFLGLLCLVKWDINST